MINDQTIRDILAAGNLTQTEFAERIGVTQPTVSRWLRGTRIDFEHREAVKSLMGELGLLDPTLDPRVTMVPLLSWVAAGQWSETVKVESWEDVPHIPVAGLPGGRWIALRVEGTSMNLIAPPGALLIINRNERSLVSGRDYVFATDDHTTFKRFYANPFRFEPFSSDPLHRTLYPAQEVRVIGRVERVQIDL